MYVEKLQQQVHLNEHAQAETPALGIGMTNVSMYVEKLQENVRVFADFSGTKVRPVAFIRKTGRRYDIARVNLVYRKRVGDRYHWCFACSDEANTYVLFYDPESLVWTLREVQMDG